MAAASSVGYLAAADEDTACTPAADQLRPVWNDSRRAGAEAALAGSDEPVPLHAWARTASALDAYAAEWTDVYDRTCKATDVAEELRLERRLCLQWELETLQPMTDALFAGKTDAVGRVQRELAEFPKPTECETAEQLRRLAQSRALGTSPTPSRRGLVSDFEDGADVVGGAGWAASSDSVMGGSSEANVDLTAPGAHGSKQALRLVGNVGAEGPVTWGGTMMFPGNAPFGPTNLSEEEVLTFWVRGNVPTSVVMLFTVRAGFNPAMHPFAVSPKWTLVRVPLDKLDPQRFDVTGIFFGAVEPGAYEIDLDNVAFE